MELLGAFFTLTSIYNFSLAILGAFTFALGPCFLLVACDTCSSVPLACAESPPRLELLGDDSRVTNRLFLLDVEFPPDSADTGSPLAFDGYDFSFELLPYDLRSCIMCD